MSAAVVGTATVKVLAVGSAHADDQLAWRCAETLRAHLPAHVPVLCLSQPLELLLHSHGCDRLFLIDAADGGQRPGSILRLQWPDPRIGADPPRSLHGFGLQGTLRLAESLGQLPSKVVIFTMQFERLHGSLHLSQRVAAAVPELARQILEEIEASHHPDPAGGE